MTATLALVQLCRWRLARTWLGRLGWVGGVLPAVAVFASALGHEARSGAVAALALVAGGVRLSAWAGGGAAALAAASNQGARDRAEGVELLCATRGATAVELRRARVLAAMVEIALRIAVPWWACCAALALFGRSPAVLWQGAAATAFALLSGALLGAVATACGDLAGRRGRTLLAAVVLAPWLIASSFIGSPWSIPGLLGRAADVLWRPVGAMA